MTIVTLALTGVAVVLGAASYRRAKRAEAASRAVALLLVRAEADWSRRHDEATVDQDGAGMLVATTTLTDLLAARQRLGA